MQTPHPWRDLREHLPHVTVHWRSLPWPLSGCTDGQRVWMHDGLTQVQRRCTIAHEMIHVRMGHTSRQPEPVERQVRRATAAYLLPDMEVVRRELAWAHCLEEAADSLWVTPGVLTDWLALNPPARSTPAR